MYDTTTLDLSESGDQVVVESCSDTDQLPAGQFVETFDGCAKSFTGDKTFMDDFWEDQYAEQR